MKEFTGISGKMYKEIDTTPPSPERPKWWEAEEPKCDEINHPSHYKVGGIETIDFIEAKGLNYHLGNVVKYITRADYKGNRLQDLKKAQWYLNRAILNLENGE